MLGAGLLAKKAVERGLQPKPWVKTSFAPGSKVVTDYLEKAGLWPYLENARASIWSATAAPPASAIAARCPTPSARPSRTIISSPSPSSAAIAISKDASIRSVRANYLASPPLVVAYALAGRMDVDIVNESLGNDKSGKPVYLREIWPTPTGSRNDDARLRHQRNVPQGIRRRFHRRRALARAARPRRRSLRLGREIHLHQASAVLRRHAGQARRARRFARPARARRSRRQRHHRPHFARRLHSAGWLPPENI